MEDNQVLEKKTDYIIWFVSLLLVFSSLFFVSKQPYRIIMITIGSVFNIGLDIFLPIKLKSLKSYFVWVIVLSIIIYLLRLPFLMQSKFGFFEGPILFLGYAGHNLGFVFFFFLGLCYYLWWGMNLGILLSLFAINKKFLKKEIYITVLVILFAIYFIITLITQQLFYDP